MNPAATPPAAARRRFPDWMGPRLVAALTLLTCLGFTAAIWLSARAVAEQQLQADFNFRVREVMVQLESRLQAYIQVLHGVQGFYHSSTNIERDEFHTYVEAQQLERHFSGIHGVGFVPLLAGAQLGAHEAAVRAEGYPAYAVRPAGRRDWYAPVVFIEPFNAFNALTFGDDLYAEPLRHAALERARDTGQAALTGKLLLVQDGANPARVGFLMVVPVYRNGAPRASAAQRRAALSGWVFAPFRIDDLMAGLNGAHGKLLDLEIHDGDGLDAASLMYDAAPGPAAALLRTSLRHIDIGGRRWSLVAGATAGFDDTGAGRPRRIAGAGIAVSLGLSLLAWLLARGRFQARVALRRARVLTRQLNDGQASLLALADAAQRSQAMLRSILDSTVDGILVDSPGGAIFTSNRRFCELWRVPDALDWQADGAALFDHVGRQLEQPAPFDAARREAPPEHDARRDLLSLRDGRVIEQLVRAMQLGNEVARLWSFRDITERSQVEQRERTRRHVLELLATGAPLNSVLESVVHGVEAANPAMLCSILLLDGDSGRVLVGAAPSLPAFFNAEIHGQKVDAIAGSCGQTLASGRRVIAADIGADPWWQPYRALAQRAGLAACWSEPVRGAQGKMLGTLAIYHRRPNLPGAAHIALIEEASQLAGIAVEQAQSALALRAGEARFRSLYDHAPVALWEQDWSALRTALAQPELVELAALARLGDNGDLGACLAARPELLHRLAGLVRIVDVNAAALAQVGAAGIAELSLEQVFGDGAMRCFARALAALVRGEQLFECESGFLRLDGVARDNELTLLVMPGHAHSLDFVIVSTLDITERKRMNAELLMLATTDFLTGLPNRRQFMARLDDEQARLQREVESCATVLMLDIDLFKHVNDEHGHAVGDAVLRHLGGLMLQTQRKIDSLGRIGGEEFAMMLPGTDTVAAGLYAERLRRLIADTPLSPGNGLGNIAVTVSIGIAAMSGAEADCDSVLLRADQALYCAKRGGRNRVEQSISGGSGWIGKHAAN